VSREQAALNTAGVSSLQVVEFALARHLTLQIVAATRADVVVDCSAMESYDVDARAAFVDWNSRMRSRVAHLAVLTTKPMWHLVVSGMALASRQKMKAFVHRTDALAWFAER
jgi:hypothetical protein